MTRGNTDHGALHAHAERAAEERRRLFVALAPDLCSTCAPYGACLNDQACNVAERETEREPLFAQSKWASLAIAVMLVVAAIVVALNAAGWIA